MKYVIINANSASTWSTLIRIEPEKGKILQNQRDKEIESIKDKYEELALKIIDKHNKKENPDKRSIAQKIKDAISDPDFPKKVGKAALKIRLNVAIGMGASAVAGSAATLAVGALASPACVKIAQTVGPKIFKTASEAVVGTVRNKVFDIAQKSFKTIVNKGAKTSIQEARNKFKSLSKKDQDSLIKETAEKTKQEVNSFTEKELTKQCNLE